MEKQTKNILTREMIVEDLRTQNTKFVRGAVGVFAITLLFIPLSAIFFNACVLPFDKNLLGNLLMIFSGTLLLLPVCQGIYFLCSSLKDRARLLKGEFDVSLQKVLYKSEKRYCRRFTKFAHFTGFKPIPTSNMTSPGDEFYLVYYKGSKSIKLRYPLKSYEYKEQ